MEATEGLSGVLDEVLLAVRTGRFDQLEMAARRLEAGEEQLAGMGAGALSAIRRKAEMNAQCLAAALRGVRAARRRIAEIADLQKGMTTYDCHGRRDETQRPPGGLVERF
jgi:hypothetical protein